MNFNTTTRIPINDKYGALIGKAVYAFAYYEWTLIWIIDHLNTGFVLKYCRGNPLTSGKVKEYFKSEIDKIETDFINIKKRDFEKCLEDFSCLIIKRNALIHAHPSTDRDGSQILSYQTKLSKSLPDMKWTQEEVENIILDIDKAAVKAGMILDKIRE